jgi:cytolysin (calcineurin-like family phosphatase)
MGQAQDAIGMKGYRTRDENGRLRDKRDDTHMGTIEKQYDRDFGVRSDMHLGTYLEMHNIKSLNDLLNGH